MRSFLSTGDESRNFGQALPPLQQMMTPQPMELYARNRIVIHVSPESPGGVCDHQRILLARLCNGGGASFDETASLDEFGKFFSFLFCGSEPITRCEVCEISQSPQPVTTFILIVGAADPSSQPLPARWAISKIAARPNALPVRLPPRSQIFALLNSAQIQSHGRLTVPSRTEKVRKT